MSTFNIYETTYPLTTFTLRVMGLNSPHMVYTVGHSLCDGSFLYSMLTMKNTLFGIIHAFIVDSYITNTTHKNTRSMIQRMVIFVYYALVDQDIDDDGMLISHNFVIPVR